MEVTIMPDIELKKIQPNRLNPRLEFTKAGLDELADSIKQVGLLEPIIVRPYGGEYQVVVGERRYRAAQQAGLDRVPVIIRDYTDDEVMELNLSENIHREDLSAAEKGNLCRKLLEKFPSKYPTQTSLAKKLGISDRTLNEWLSVSDLSDKIQRRIAPGAKRGAVPEGKVDYSTALRIARQIKEPEKAAEVIEHIAERHIPQRLVTRVAKQVVREPQKPVEQIFQKVIEEAPILLPFSKPHADAILAGIKTQTSRKAKDPRLQPGVTVRAQVTHFADLEVTDVYRKKLGDFDKEDARREGGYTLDQFKEVWKKLHGEWNPNESVYITRFRLVRVVGEPDSPS
ncbi:MAG: ParB/RepB/Spo0J family partition protein [Chloroflexi bacterium]|nr:ParB/RepB/Spo0J family partition protein [Chloroflexota bacterium]